MANNWNDWIGKTQTTQDLAAHSPVQRLAATLDREWTSFCPNNSMPPLAHWLYFLPSEAQSLLGDDGHAKKGAQQGIMPPVALPRRMWAGSQIEFHRDIPLGSAIERRSSIANITEKQGRTGSLVFVKVAHNIYADGKLAITDCHDIVYREAVSSDGSAGAVNALTAPTDEHYCRTVKPDAVLLFRYSALTFNGHRIHYDYPYVTDVEGYPGLIVHGPLVATLLLDEFRKQHPTLRITKYEFKAVSTLFSHQTFEVCGRVEGQVAHLWARNHEGALAMQATVTFV